MSIRIDPQQGGVVEVVFGPAGELPICTEADHTRLATLWGELASEPAHRVILVRSEGTGFSAGGDMALLQGMLASETTRMRVMHEARAIVQGMMDCDLPIISAIHGAAAGAGAAVALMADISVAADSARIIDAHTKLGVAAGDHAAVIWPLLCGMAKAKYHLLTCAPVTGQEAERIGLVSLSVPPEALLDRARTIAAQLAGGSRSALGHTKRSLNHWLRAAWPAFEHSLALEFLGFAGSDAREGVAAFTEKRPARFA